MEQAMGQISTNLQSQMTERFSSLGSQMEGALKIDADAFRNAIRFNMTEDDLAELMKSKMMSTSATYARRNRILIGGSFNVSRS